MRYAFSVMLCVVSLASAQTPEIDAKLATLKFLGSLYDSESGGYRNEPIAKASLRATNAAVKATKYLGGKLDDKEKTAKFVLGCYDDKTGAFAEPGGNPDVTTSCIGVMAAMELGIAKEKIAKAPEYVSGNAEVFEDVRIAAAAVEAWGGVKEWPKKIDVFIEVVKETPLPDFKTIDDGLARATAAAAVTIKRLGAEPNPDHVKLVLRPAITTGQAKDGGWRKVGAESSDMETCYRVMRACHMLKYLPRNLPGLKEFIAKHRNEDGGYAAKPGEKSSAAGTYYAVIVTKWLDELEKK